MTGSGPKTSDLLESLYLKWPSVYDRSSDKALKTPFGERGGFECGPGWAHILDRLGAILARAGCRVAQVKEKFGTLRIYLDEGKDTDTGLAIELAEMASASVCESCGETGSLRSGGRWRTLCDSCNQDYLNGRWSRK